MPNGGSDCCARCEFKRILSEEERPEIWINSYCTIRNEYILNSGYTYCANWHTKSKTPQGPMFSRGLYSEGDPRVPWYNKNEPINDTSGKCLICSKEFQSGYDVKDGNNVKHFCSSKHYLEWWKERFPNERLLWDCTDVDHDWERVFIQFYDEAIEINPKNSHAWFEKGRLSGIMGKYKESINCFENVIDIEPENSMAYNNKGYSLEKLGREQDAIIFYKKALEIDEDNKVARSNLDKITNKLE